MTNNKNHRDRAEINRIKNELGIGHQAATRELARRRSIGQQAESRSPFDDVSDVETLLRNAAGDALRDLINEYGARAARSMDEFTSEDLVEGTIEETTLSDFEFASWADVVEVYPVDPDAGAAGRLGVHLVVHGKGQVDWSVNVPEGLDAQKFGVMEELDNGAPEPIHEIETNVPIQLQIHVELDPATVGWHELDVQVAELNPAEAAKRSRRHSDQEFERRQELGLEPSDDEIEEMAAAYERGREDGDQNDEPPAGPESLGRR